MAEFYPSEVARLVLGYLHEVKCLKSWEAFLEESTDLQEHNRLLKAEKFCTTNVNGKSLLDILAEYCVLKKAANDSYNSKLSTPSKVNGNAYARFEINQKVQTRSFISAQTSHIPPPSPVSPFRSPTSRPTNRTPRRRLECQSTQLNFYRETDSVNNDAATTSSAQNVLTCHSSPIHSARRIIYNSSIISKDSSAYYPDSGTSSSSPKVNDKNTKEVLLSMNRSPFLMTLNSSQPKILSSPKLPKTPDKTSYVLKDSSESRTEHNESNAPTHSTPNDNLHLSIGNTKQTSELNVGSVADKQNVPSEEAVISVNQNSSVACLSSEVITSSVGSREGCSTPQYDTNPPPYTRAPLTDSPRIVLSHDRSLIASLTTPMKDKRSWTEEEWSPKRKGSLPRRRLVSESPKSKYVQQPEAGLSFDTVMENLFQIGPEDLLFNEDAPFVQLLTDNINKAKQSDMHEESHGQNGSLDDIIKNAAELTEEKIEDLFLSITQNKASNFSSVSKSDDAKCLSNTSETVNLTKTTKNIICDRNFTSVNEELPDNFMDSNQSGVNLNADEVSRPSEDIQSVNVGNHSASVLSSIDVQQMHNSFSNDAQGNNSLDSNNLSVKQPGSSKVNATELTATFNNLNSIMVANSGGFQSGDSTKNAVIKNTSIVASMSENPSTIKNCSEIGGVAATSDVNVEQNVDSVVTYNSHINKNTLQNISLNHTTHEESPKMTVVQTDLSNQPNAILEVPLPTIPTYILPSYTPTGLVQNGVYKIIVNTPIGDYGMHIRALPAANLPDSIVINSTPTVQPTDENVVTVSRNIPVANEVTVSSRKGASVSSKAKTTKACNRGAKRAKPGNTVNTKKRKTDKKVSEPKRKYKVNKNKSARKLISLFCDPSPEVNANVTPVKNSDDNIPVLSIPDSPGNSEQSSAFKLLSQITGQYEKADKSPVLKSLMSEAALLSKKGPRLNSSHVRCLDFTSASDNNNDNDESNSSKGSKESKVSVPKRRSSRIRKNKMSNLKTYERKNLKNRNNDFSLSGNGNSAKISSTDNLNASLFSKTLDVLNCSEDNMQIVDDVQNDNLQVSTREKSDAETASTNTLFLNEAQIEPQRNANRDCEENFDVITLSDNSHSGIEDGNHDSFHKDDSGCLVDNCSNFSDQLRKKPRKKNKTLKSSGKKVVGNKFCASKSKTQFSKNCKNSNSQENESSTLPVHNEVNLCINSPVEKVENNKKTTCANNFVAKSTLKQDSNKKTREKDCVSESSQLSPVPLSERNEPIQNKEKHVTEMAGTIIESNLNAAEMLTENIKIAAGHNAKNISDIDVMQKKDVNTDKDNSCSILPDSKLPAASALNSENIMTPGKSDLSKRHSLSVLCFGYDSLDDESPAKMKNHSSPHPSLDLNSPNRRKLDNSTNIATGNSEGLKSRKTDECNSPSLIKSNITKSISSARLSINHDTKDSAASNANAVQQHPAKGAFSPSSGNKNSSPSRNNDKVCNLKQCKEKGVISPSTCSKNVSLNTPVSKRNCDNTPIEEPEPVSSMSTSSLHPSLDLNSPNRRKLDNSTNIATGNSEGLKSRKTDECNSPSLIKSNITKSISSARLSINHDTKDSAASNANAVQQHPAKGAFSPSSGNKNSSPSRNNDKVCNLKQCKEKEVISPSTCSKNVSLNTPVSKRNCDNTPIEEPEPVSSMSTCSTFNINNNTKKSASTKKATERKSLENIISFCKDKENAKRQISKSIILLNEENTRKENSDLVNKQSVDEVLDSTIVNNISSKNTSCDSVSKVDVAAEENLSQSLESTCMLNESTSNSKSQYTSKTDNITNLAVSEKQVTPCASMVIPHNESNCSSKTSTENVIDKNVGNKVNSPNISSSVTNNKVAPPPKKRIRPIPVDSSSNESFGPFTQFLPNQNTAKATAFPSLEKKNFNKKSDSSTENYPTRKYPNKTAEFYLSKVRSECNNILDYENLNSNPLSPLSSLLSPLKQFQVVPEFKSPVSKIVSKSASPSPSTKSVPRSSYFISGKPKAMADFYKNAFPSKGGELPISPISFSSSSFSCTGDAFRAKRNLQEANANLFDKNEVDSIHVVENICDLTKDLHKERNPPEVSHNPIIKENPVQECHSLEKMSIEMDPVENNALVLNAERKRKISQCDSDCSTIVDLSDTEIMTPVKGDDWLDKDIFCRTPFSEKRNKFSDMYTDSDITPDSSPEKMEYSSNKLEFSNTSSNNLPAKVSVNDPDHSCDVNVDSVDPEKNTTNDVSLHKINVSEGRNVNKSSTNLNSSTMTPMKGGDLSNKDVSCKTPLSEKRKSFNDIYTDSDVSSDSSLEKVELSGNALEFSNISFNRLPVNVSVNDSNNLCNVNVNSVDPEKRTAGNRPLHKTNVNESQNLNKSSMNHNVDTKSKSCKINDRKSTKNPSFKTESKSLSKQAIPERVNNSYSDSNELNHDAKKSCNTGHNTKERQSRPTLKIASLKSPFKNQANNRNSESPKKCEGKTLKNKITAPKLQNGRNKDNIKMLTGVKGNAEVKITGNKLVTNSKLGNGQTDVAKLILGNKTSLSTATQKPNSSRESTKPIGTIDQCESTRDIVESDIGRSNEEGSELSIAIASVERELQISQPDHNLCCPRLEASNTFQSNVEEKAVADATLSDQKEIEKFKNTPMCMDVKLYERLMSKINLHGLDKVQQDLQGMLNSRTNKK